MKIWITRHGQTRLNKARLMQGLTDEPLNEKGLEQARMARQRIGDVHFDAVYASPLNRAIMTGAIIGGVDPSEVIIDKRIIEANFGNYEQKNYYLLGPSMTLYWAVPEIFPRTRVCLLRRCAFLSFLLTIRHVSFHYLPVLPDFRRMCSPLYFTPLPR